jgi:hypothetical protein
MQFSGRRRKPFLRSCNFHSPHCIPNQNSLFITKRRADHTTAQCKSFKCLRVKNVSVSVSVSVSTAVSRRLATAATQGRYLVISYAICAQSGIVRGFLRILQFPLSILIPVSPPYAAIVWADKPTNSLSIKCTQPRSIPRIKKLTAYSRILDKSILIMMLREFL